MNIGKRRVNAWTEVWDFQLAGSSYKAPDGSSRQSSLRRAAEKQEDLEAVVVELERYEYDGAPAYHVYFDDCDVGSVPATVAQELAQMEAAGYSVSGDDCEVYGGPEDDFPDKKYGARIYVRLRRKLTDTEKQDELSKLAKKAAQLDSALSSARPSGCSSAPAFVYSDSSFPRATSAGDDSPPHSVPEPPRYADDDAARGPEVYEKRPRKKSKLLTILLIILAIYVIYLIPQIISAIIGARDFKNSPAEMQASAQAVSDRLAAEGESDTPAPAESGSEPEPAPAEETFIPPEPITYTGSGDDYFDISPFDSLYYFQITGNSDARHFSVTGYDSSGDYTELFVNTTDYYTGSVLDSEQNTRTLEVKAEGDWTITIVSLYTAPVVKAGETYSGIDDAVLLIPLGSSSAVINGNSWSRHFAVKTYGDGFDLLVNTVDPYSGTVRVDSDATVMTVTAEGGWSILLQ